jgi:hypothetical protein
MSRTATGPWGLELVGEPTVLLPASLKDVTAVFAAACSPFVPHKAREFVARVCKQWECPRLAEAASLVADELVTNAVLHARTPLELHLRREAASLLVAVHDRGPDFDPSWWRPTSSGDDEPRGARYGLTVVRGLAESYGGFQHPAGGKVVWAALYLPPTSAGQAPDTIDLRDGGPRGPEQPTEPGQPELTATVRRTVLVNGARRRGDNSRVGWRLELLLGWNWDDPDWVDLTLRPTPLHPALPQGHWRVRRDTLRASLEGPANDPQVRCHPDPAGYMVLLDLTADRPHIVHVHAQHLRAFLAETDESARRHGS